MDLNGLLTVIGLLVAVYAILPRERRLDLKLRFSRLDGIVTLVGLGVIHYQLFLPNLKQLGLGYTFGPYKYGLNNDSAIYLICLVLVIYLVTRAYFARVNEGNVKTAYELVEETLLSKSYLDLSVLIENHIADIVRLSEKKSFRGQLAEKITTLPHPLVDINYFNQPNSKNSKFSKLRDFLGKKIYHKSKNKSTVIAESILRRLANNQDFISFIVSSRPYLGITLIKMLRFWNRENFVEQFISKLMDDQTSIYYYEIEQTQNSSTGHRLEIIENNKLFFYLFHDVKIAESLAIYKPVGDKVIDILDYDSDLLCQYNRPIGNYFEVGRKYCPIDCSIHFFNIMILESMHQGIRWHMWLFYFPTFVEKILDRYEPANTVDFDREWPTPFHYIFYHITYVMLDWIDEIDNVEDKEPLAIENQGLNHDNGSIPKSACLAVGNIIFMLISSTKLKDSFKGYILEIALRHIRDRDGNEVYASTNLVLMKSIIRNGFRNKSDLDYIEKLTDAYTHLDHVLVHDTEAFLGLLNSARTEVGLNTI